MFNPEKVYFCETPGILSGVCPTYAAAIELAKAAIEAPDNLPTATHLDDQERAAGERAIRGLGEDLIAEGRTGLEAKVSEMVPAGLRCPTCPISAVYRLGIPDDPSGL